MGGRSAQRNEDFEPSSHFSRRLKLLFLVRLIPLCESNYNLVELGPRGTGKSYAYQEMSPYTILMTGPTTVANLFDNIASGKIGLVGLWDAVAFDEVADLEKMPKEVITTLKTYCESGTFARGGEVMSGTASIAMFGNTNQPVETMVPDIQPFCSNARGDSGPTSPFSIAFTIICRAGKCQRCGSSFLRTTMALS